MDMP